MIIYHPSYDFNHYLYRSFLILNSYNDDEIDLSLYRLMDFYILQPFFLKKIKPLPRDLSGYRTIINNIKEPYEALKNINKEFYKVTRLQDYVFQYLIKENIIDENSLADGIVKKNCHWTTDKMQKPSNLDKEIFDLIIHEIPAVYLHNQKKFKERSQVMEYRYDSMEKI